jgi:hypothetical protein
MVLNSVLDLSPAEREQIDLDLARGAARVGGFRAFRASDDCDNSSSAGRLPGLDRQHEQEDRPRVWLGGRYPTGYVLLWERERGAVPSGWTVHHFKCGDILC